MLTEQTFRFQSVAINATENEKCFHFTKNGAKTENSASPTYTRVSTKTKSMNTRHITRKLIIKKQMTSTVNG
jgi:hypothetical protein